MRKKTKTKKSIKRKKSMAGKTAKPFKKEKPIGRVTHFFGGIKVAIIKFKKSVKIGSKVRIMGATTDFDLAIGSMQYDHKPVMVAAPNKQVGIKVSKRVREGDEVFILK